VRELRLDGSRAEIRGASVAAVFELLTTRLQAAGPVTGLS